MNKGLRWCLVLCLALSSLGVIVPAAVAQDDTLTCEERFNEAGHLLIERRNALNEGNVVLALSLIRQASDLVAPCVEPGMKDVLRSKDSNALAPVVAERGGAAMVRVPSGCFMMGYDEGEPDEQPAHEICFYSPYWIDQTEVTRAMYDECVAAGACTPTDETDLPVGPDHPASRVSWFQAATYCDWRGVRLPSEAEWEYAARGPAGWRYPWSNEFNPDNLVYDLNADDVTAPVGSIPAGASWVGALDMSGNVTEWVRTAYHPYPYDPTYNLSAEDTDSPRVARGGSYMLALSSDLTGIHRASYEPSFQLDNIGFRCADVPAQRPEHLAPAADCTARIEQALDVQRWEADAIELDDRVFATLLTDLSRALLEPCAENARWMPRVETFSGVDMAFVPTGCFQMGRADGPRSEQPVHDVCLDQAFWLDRTEVTHSMYAQCVDAGVCTWVPGTDFIQSEQLPVSEVTWFQARTYCGWRGARLPTEAEWEYAARGPENRLYPWGDTFSSRNLVFAEQFGAAEVGSIPAGASWVGALDMSGNVQEWVSSVFVDYPYNPTAAEQPANTSAPRVLRGGSFYNFDEDSVTTTRRDRAVPDFALSTNGFRCARDG